MLHHDEYPRSMVVKLPEFDGWYRWDFVSDEKYTLMFTTFSHFAEGMHAYVRNEGANIYTMTIYDPEKIVGHVSTFTGDIDGKDNKE